MTEENKTQQPRPFGKAFRTQTDDPWIEVLHGGQPYAFRASMIHHLASAKDEKSMLAIQRGPTITLSLSYPALIEKICGGYSPLDLKEHCESANTSDAEVGQMIEGEGVFAGLTADGRQQIFAAPTDLEVTMAFNDAAKAVERLNADEFLGHSDWQIPSVENLRILQKNRERGVLRGTFKAAGFAKNRSYPEWYWSSWEDPATSCARIIHFQEGNESWNPKERYQLSCRPVRLAEIAL